MSVTSLIEFDDVAEHDIPPALELNNDKGQLKSQVDADEILFANYDADAELTSKRGAKELVFGGFNNTGQVLGGILDFPNQDRSIASYENITEIVDDFAFRAKVIMNVAVPTSSRDTVKLKSNVDLSEVYFWLSTGGSGTTRMNFTHVDSAGTLVALSALATRTMVIGDFWNVALSNDDNGNMLVWVDGVLVQTIVSPAFDFTDCNLILGEDTNLSLVSIASFDNVQLFNSDEITVADAFPFPEPTTFVLTEQVLETKIPLLVDEILDLGSPTVPIVEEIPAGTLLKHILQLNSDRYWHNGTAWVLVDSMQPLIPQSNTPAEISANVASLPIVKGIGKIVEIHHVFQSTGGYATPLIESLSMKYKFTFKAGNVPLCTIYHLVLDNAGAPVVGATLRVQSEDQFINNSLVGPSAKVITNDQGKASISVPQGILADFFVEYTEKKIVDGVEVDNFVVFEHEGKTIPALASAELETL